MAHNEYLTTLYLAGTFLITSFAVSLTIFFVIQKKRQMRSFLEQQKLKFDYEHSLLTTKLEVQEQAFETVSRDIHDGVGQVLSLGCIQLADLKNSISDTAALSKLDDALMLFKKSVKDLRLLSHSLNTGLIEYRDLKQSIETEFNRIEAFTDIKCIGEIPDSGPVLTAQQKLIIFRVVQEALHNVLKYAQAATVRISMTFSANELQVEIEDDGVGFDTGAYEGSHSLGILSMQQRAKLLNALFTIRSAPGSGTTVTLSIPTNESA